VTRATNIGGRVDVHAHLLPGIDDGCKSVEESIACARALVANGYTHAFCTPHIWPTYKGVSRVSVPRWCKALQAELARAGVPLELLPGGEMNIYLGVDKTPADEVVSLGLGKYMLVDMWAPEIPPHFEQAVRWLQGMGLTVILAHPERMRAVQDRPELADYFASLGVLLQGNLQCFSDRPDAATRQVVEQYILDGRYFLLGSDSHNPQSMDVRMNGLRRAIELVGEAKVNQLTVTNPRKLVPGLP
jgi:protein-tyrosine phosphatase